MPREKKKRGMPTNTWRRNSKQEDVRWQTTRGNGMALFMAYAAPTSDMADDDDKDKQQEVLIAGICTRKRKH